MVDKAMSASQSMVQPDGTPEQGACWPSEMRTRSFRTSEADGADGDCRADTSSARRLLLLARTIERDVIPRLVLAHRTTRAAYVDRPPGLTPTPQDVATLTALAIRADLKDVEAFVDGVQAAGIPLDRVYLDLLAPVARRLGEMWEADECDFATVTMGLAALQQVVLNSGRRFTQAPQRPRVGRRALLAPTPGETHTFGLVIVAEFFRRAGWEVWSGTGASQPEIVAKVRGEHFAIAAFSMAREDHTAALADLIQRVRRASVNRRIGILVGGAIFAERPRLVSDIGADATAADGDEATLQAETLIAISDLRA
ncbi:cobalamin B12-binding domain-containing protein [Humitalea sp. 24SJ18S-53]|uniref:cobalamin B12-binding domain-containing protein n=1 Tax=Humitalea sp. 24SJ18S-53 TaxID=3422307 RepID=UPI003D66791A